MRSWEGEISRPPLLNPGENILSDSEGISLRMEEVKEGYRMLYAVIIPHKITATLQEGRARQEDAGVYPVAAWLSR